MNTSLKNRLQTDTTVALKAGDKKRLETLRFITAAIKQFEVDNYPPSNPGEITEEEVVNILQKLAKRHRESIGAFDKAERFDLSQHEKEQLSVVEGYIPQQMATDKITGIVKKVIEEKGTDFGLVMKTVMQELKGKADGALVSQIVKTCL